MKYSQEQIDGLKLFYPESNYDELFKLFPGKTKRQIKGIAHYYGIKSNNPGHALDLTGQRFGRLVALEIDHRENSRVYWNCKCDCGKNAVVVASCLLAGHTKSCGCLAKDKKHTHTAKDHTGERFGKLVAIERFPRYNGSRTYYLCKCDCGNEKMVSGSTLVSGHVVSCGCITKRADFWSLKHENASDSRMYIVYKHTAPNGKSYIGITKQQTNKRWQNGFGYATQQFFWRAIQKYGWENFTHEVLEDNLGIEDALAKEKYYIEKYQTVDREYGYNVHQGGTSGRNLVTPVMQLWKGNPVNFFESISYAASELKVTSGTIRNYINSQDLPDGYSFEELPIIHTYDIDEELYQIRDEYHYRITQLMKEAQHRKTVTRNQTLTRQVNQYYLDGKYIRTWDSIADIKRSGPGFGSISAVLRSRGNCKSAGGFLWKYDDGNHSDIDPADITMGRKPVVQIDPETGRIIGEYISAVEAEHQTGVPHAQISKCCTHTRKTAGGFGWVFKFELIR